MLEFSEVESHRFKRDIYRAYTPEVTNDLRKKIIAEKPDLVILRIPSSEISNLHKLQIYGVPPLVADTLVYYSLDLTAYAPGEYHNNNLSFKSLGPENLPILSELVRDTFANYKNHYAANPYLHPSDIAAAFTNWGESFAKNSAQKIGWLVYLNSQPVAFCNCAIHGDSFEGVLYGVHPDYAGHGIYGDMITFTQNFAKNKGFKSMFVSTQINNMAVQKAWVQRGFKMDKSQNTVHLNLFMSDDWILKSHREKVIVSNEMIQAIGNAVEDHNPIHFDDQAAKDAGFRGRIAHGVLSNGFFSKILGTSLPGSGSIYLSQTSQFLAPVYPGQEYEFEVALKFASKEQDLLLLRTMAYNSKNRPVFYGLATVRNSGFLQTL